MPEEESGESIDEIDPIKPHADFQSDEPEEPIITPNDLIAVSPEQPRQV